MSKSPLIRSMVALGSSFAAGPGVPPVVDRAAGRSRHNYPQLVARALGAELVDATVSGATTATILDESQRTLLRTFPPQIASVHPATDLVTITAGGNDLGYVGGIFGAAIPTVLERHRPTRPFGRRLRNRQPAPSAPTAEALAAATAGLVRVVAEVRRRAPAARVVLVDYLPMFTAGSLPGPTVPFTTAEIVRFRAVAAILSQVFADAAGEAAADLVPASAYDQHHGLGEYDPWIAGLHFPSPAGAFHPTPAGMRAVADAVLAQLSST